MKNNPQKYAKTSFNDVSEQYDQIGFFKISAQHVADLVEQNLPRVFSGKSVQVLDIACGTGNVVLECARRLQPSLKQAQFKAVDISEDMIRKAKSNATKEGLDIEFAVEDISNLTTDKSYDVITCSYALFFLPNPEHVLQTLYTLLNQNGCLIFTSFTAEAFQPTQKIILSLLSKYGSASAQNYDTDRWQNLRSIENIEELCKMASIKNTKIEKRAIRYPMDLQNWWELLNNTGYKGMLMELSDESYRLVKQHYILQMQAFTNNNGENELIADSFYTIIHKESFTRV